MYQDTKNHLKRAGVFLGLIISISSWSGWILYDCYKSKEIKKSQGIEKVVEEKPSTFEEYKESLKGYRPKFPEFNYYKYIKKEKKFYKLSEVKQNGQI